MFTIYLLSFIISILMSLHIPIIAVYALEIDIPPYEIGLISGFGSLVYALSSPLSGIISSRVGEKWTIIISFTLLSLSYILFLSAKNSAVLTAIFALSLLAYAIFWPAVESFVSHSGGSVAAFSSAWSSGTIVGSIIVSPLIIVPKSIVFLGMSIATLALVSAAAKLGRVDTEVYTLSLSDIARGILGAPHAWIWAFSYSAILGSIFAFYPIIVEVWSLPVWYVSLVFFSVTGARTLTFMFYNVLPAVVASPIAGSLFIASGFILPYIRDPPLVVLSSLIVGAGVGILYGRALSVAFHSGSRDRRIYTGLFESFIGFGYTVGPVIAGVASTLSLDLAIPTATLVSFLAAFSSSTLGKPRS